MRLITLIGGCAILVATAAAAHKGVQNPHVRARMEHMNTIAEDTKVLGLMTKGETNFDASSANAALASIARRALEIPTYFENPAEDPKSESRSDIWEQWGTFHALSLDLAEASVADLAGPDDLRPVMARIGAACRACHEAFRK